MEIYNVIEKTEENGEVNVKSNPCETLEVAEKIKSDTEKILSEIYNEDEFSVEIEKSELIDDNNIKQHICYN